MQERFLNVIASPCCKESVSVTKQKVNNGEILEGAIHCNKCGRAFEISQGVPRLILDLEERKEIAESFGCQWQLRAESKFESDSLLYGQTGEEEIEWFFRYFGIEAAELRGKVVLDAGCGCGRLTKALSAHGKEIVGIDISSSIGTDYQACMPSNNVALIQADVLNPPFRKASFDYVWSEDTICYVKDVRKAFDALADLVKPSGKFFVRLPSTDRSCLAVKLRGVLSFSHRISRKILFNLCYCLAIPWTTLKLLLGKKSAGLRSNAFFLFNALSPGFIAYKSEQEAISWFKENNFSDIQVIPDRAIAIRGTKT
jgi:2-polyprenyl-3-methyl-5-hydroxy-6-metoxy-1,4-benzoquinol methylase